MAAPSCLSGPVKRAGVLSLATDSASGRFLAAILALDKAWGWE